MLIALVRSSCKVMLFPLHRRSVPDIVALLVDANVTELCANEDKDVIDTNANSDTIAATVEQFATVLVNLGNSSLFVHENVEGKSTLPLEAMVELTCTDMLYSEDATIRVRTIPALLDPRATRMACIYG